MSNILRYVNNWEYDEYYVNDIYIDKLEAVRINGKVYDAIRRPVNVPYHDMGHEYSTTSPHFFVKDEFGVEVDLNQVVRVCDVEVLKFEGRSHKEVYPEEYEDYDDA